MTAKPNNYDFLIVGQGLAGSLLGWQLEKRGQNYLLIDQPYDNSASSVSAGIVNPLIGRSFNLPWKFKELDLLARKFYQELSENFQTQFLHNQKIIRVLNNQKQHRQLQQKINDSDYTEYIGELIDSYHSLKFQHQAFWTNGSYWIEIADLVRTMSKFFQTQNRLLLQKFQYSELQYDNQQLHYQDLTFNKVIFAEGYRAIDNSFADFLHFRPAKGEILDLHIPGLGLDHLVNFGHFLLPLGNDHYRLGATYGWKDWEEKLPLNPQHPLLIALAQLTDLPYKIINHHLGVRPIVAGQKPVIGAHPDRSGIFFLNGLGSKGAILAPYCAKMLAEHLLSDAPIDPEISTSRFTGEHPLNSVQSYETD